MQRHGMAARKQPKKERSIIKVEVVGDPEIGVDPVKTQQYHKALHTIYGIALTRHAESLPEGDDKKKALAAAKWWIGESAEEKFERERHSRELDRMLKQDKQDQAFVGKE